MSIFRHFEESVGEAFGKGLCIGGLVGIAGGAALMFLLGLATGAYR